MAIKSLYHIHKCKELHQTLNHEIAHHNNQGETSATAMGKLGNFAYNIGTSLNQEDIGTHRQAITPTAQTLQNPSTEDEPTIKQDNQALLNANEVQRAWEVESGDGVWNAPIATKQGQIITKRHKKNAISLVFLQTNVANIMAKKNLKTLKEIGLFILPTTPEEITIAVVTSGAGRYVIKAGGKVISKVFTSEDEAKAVLAEAKKKKFSDKYNINQSKPKTSHPNQSNLHHRHLLLYCRHSN